MIALTMLFLAADCSGIWTGQIPTRNNDKLDIAFQFKQTGEALTGKIYGDFRSTPIVEGKVTGEELTFVVMAEEQAGNQINETRVKYTGVCKDGAIELTRRREGSTNAGNAGGVQPRKNDAPVTFQLKKLL
jgi:hypothetical protein